MIGCNQHFKLSDTPHLSGIAVTNGGTGYTSATVVITPSYGAAAKAVITSGAITSIVLTSAGHGAALVPVVEIVGTGTGATAVASITGGYQVLENTTTVDDWRASDDPDNPGTPCLDYSATPINPEPVPICDADVTNDPCNCVQVEPDYVENTFEATVPPSYRNAAICRKIGYKNLFARKEWHGEYGFINSSTPSQVKYLTKHVSISLDWHSNSSAAGLDQVYTGRIEYEEQYDRYSGYFKVVQNDISWIATGNGDQTAMRKPTEAQFNAFIEAHGEFGVIFPSVSEYNRLYVASPYEYSAASLLSEINSATSARISTTGSSVTMSDTELHIADIESDYLNDGGNIITGSMDLRINVILSSPYTPDEVKSDAYELLDETGWDLCDDLQYPWRYDVPVLNSSPANHYTPNYGPSYGPLVSYQQNVDEVRIMGQPTSIGSDPFWDSTRINYLFEDSDPPTYNYCWRPQTYGAYSPFPHATQWMPDITNNMFLPGAHATFNSPLRQYRTCSDTYLCLDASTFYISRWAEIYLWEFPHEQERRPCGPADAATIDPDTVCDETPSLRWPGIPSPCTEPETLRQGSYTIDEYQLTGTGTDDNNCTSGEMVFTRCRPSAMFIQSAEPDGAYGGALHVSPPTIGEFIESVDGSDANGFSAITQFHQAMADPLWEQPKICSEGNPINDPDAVTPYVENTSCGTEPGNYLPWSHVEVSI